MEKEIKKLGKLYCSFGHIGEANWILPLGFELTPNIDEANVVVFGGGKDVDPGFYNEKIGSRTCKPNERDKAEKKDFEYVQKLRQQGKSILSTGICRGHQLLTALSGGMLIQDVGNHHGDHSMSTFDKKEINVNSIHHQMVYHYKMDRRDFKMFGWSTKNISSKYLNGWDKSVWLPNSFKEIESIYYPKTHSIGFQYHPEMLFYRGSQSETITWTQTMFLKAFENKL